MDSDYPNTPKIIKDALFSCIIVDFKSPEDRRFNDFLLDTLNACEKTFAERNKIK